MKPGRPMGIWILTAVAITFGLLTIKSGGSVLFLDGPARQAAGNFVPFVVWFNFLAGFFYLMAAVGLWLQRRWAVWLSCSIAVATLAIFAALGLHILNEGLYEHRTVMAMGLRSVVWVLISVLAIRAGRKQIVSPLREDSSAGPRRDSARTTVD